LATGADLTVIYSTIAEGAAYEGGGIYANSATLRVINSTISGNDTSSWGGGLRAFDSTTTLVNTTIYDNTAGGGGGGAIDASGNGSLTILNSTIIDNATGVAGYGIYAASTLETTIRNSVVAGSTPAGSEIRAGDLTAGWNFFGRASSSPPTKAATSTTAAIRCLGPSTTTAGLSRHWRSCPAAR
jgi:hypothetical protein